MNELCAALAGLGFAHLMAAFGARIRMELRGDFVVTAAKRDPEDQKVLGVMKWLGLTIFAMWMASWFLIGVIGFDAPGDRGTFGDSFGALNALFSALAFVGAFGAFWLQRRELKNQLIEMRANRKQLERSAAAQEKSEQAMEAQTEALIRQAAALEAEARAIEQRTAINLALRDLEAVRRVRERVCELSSRTVVAANRKWTAIRAHLEKYRRDPTTVTDEMVRSYGRSATLSVEYITEVNGAIRDIGALIAELANEEIPGAAMAYNLVPFHLGEMIEVLYSDEPQENLSAVELAEGALGELRQAENIIRAAIRAQREIPPERDQQGGSPPPPDSQVS